MRRRRLIRIAVAGVGLATLAWSPQAVAVNLKATPTVALQGVYDSNLFSTSANEVSDYYLKAVPALTLTLDVPATSLDLRGAVEIDRYAEHDELDSSTATVNLGLSASRPIQFSPRLTMTPTARYLDTKDTFRRTQLTQAPVPGLPPADTLVAGRVRTRDTAASLFVTYLLGPKLDLGLGGGYGRQEFLDAGPGYVDSDISTANASVGYRVTPRFSAGPFLAAGRTRYDDGRRTETYGGGASFTYLPAPEYALTAKFGADYLRDFGTGGVLLDEEWLPSALVTGAYTKGEFKGTLGLFYGAAGGGGLGVTTKRGSVIATAASRFTERWDWSFSAVYQTNVSASGVRSADYSTLECDAGVGYLAARWARLRLAGTFFRQWARLPFGEDISRDTAFAGIDLFYTYVIF